MAVRMPRSTHSTGSPGPRRARCEPGAIPHPPALAGAVPRPRADAGPRRRTRAAADADVAAGTLPETIAPQLATLVDSAPAEDGWLYELKFDGYRLLARVDGRDVRLVTRNGSDRSTRLPRLVEAIAALDMRSGWLDGEIVVPDAAGVPDFQALQNAFDAARSDSIRYLLFDLLEHDGTDLRRLPLVARRERLRRLMTRNRSAQLRFSEALDGDPAELLAKACDIGMEGLIGKRIDAPYESGRSRSWIKLKCKRRQEFVVGGWTDPQGRRTVLGSLLLGVHDESGRLRYAGSVGTGFDATSLELLGRRLAAVAAPQSPFADRIRASRVHWAEPTLVAEVSFAEWTKDGRIRQGVFHGLRGDKPAATIRREQPVPVQQAVRETARETAPRPAGGAAAGRRTAIAISHPDRLVDPSSGLAKIDLVRYYESIAERILPHLAGRPVAMLRAPAGLGGRRFFQRHGGRSRIPGVRELDPSLDPGHDALLQIDTIDALIGAVQMNAIELHAWNARSRSIERPDRLIFDLDPGEGLGWREVVEGARLTRALLVELGLTGFVKTSGSKGLHVVVPIAARHDWETVRDFARSAVRHLAGTMPSRFVASSGAGRRVGRIFVDYLRNGRGATTVVAFSARAREGLPVSMPVAWDELDALRRSDRWTIRDAAAWVSAQRDDPWSGFATRRQTLTKAFAKLSAAVAAEPRRGRRHPVSGPGSG